MRNDIRHRRWFPLESMSEAEIDRYHLDMLRRQLSRVHARSTLYRRKLDAVGVHPDEVTSLDAYRELVPFISKADFIEDQAEFPPWGSRLVVNEADVARLEVTSGTSGLGQEVYGLTRGDIDYLAMHGAWVFALAGVEKGDKMGITLPLGYLQGPWGGHWATEALSAGAFHLGLVPDAATKLEFIRRFRINALYTPTPTYLTRLTVVAKEMGIDPREDLPELRTAVIAAESYPVEWAARMEEFWDIHIAEMYGSTQAGLAATNEDGVVVGSNRSDRGILMIPEWATYTEFLRPGTNEPAEPGEYAEPVITNLWREASPCIRFRTGDRVLYLGRDADRFGRRLRSMEAGTIGRLDDMVKIKGMNVWPAHVDEVVFGTPGCAEYQVVVSVTDDGREEMTMSVGFDPSVPTGDRPERLAELRRRLHDSTNVTATLVEMGPEEIPQFEYKARRWFDERGAGLTSALGGV